MTAIEGCRSVSDDANLEEAIHALCGAARDDDEGTVRGHSSVLVTNKAGELTGVLTLQGILKAIDRISAELGLPPDGLFERRPAPDGTAAHIPVREAMRRVVKTGVRADDDTGRAIRKLLESEADILPVTSQRKVVGIVSAFDLLRSVIPVPDEKQGVILSFLTVS